MDGTRETRGRASDVRRDGPVPPARHVALESLAQSAARNIPGADFVSVTVRSGNEPLRTLSATDPVAEKADHVQYDLHEGPCYAAVTDDRFVLVNDMAATSEFPRYGPRAVDLGIGAQAAIQLLHDGETAALNLYARHAGAFDRDTVQIAELFATQAGALLGYASQVEQLSEALHTRTDIGTAIGILMERYRIDRHQAFAFLTRNSQTRNIKVRLLAQQVIDGTFEATAGDDAPPPHRP
ncbi:MULTISPECIES: GAF and ANTAR domain-containing protein [unclassified Nocardioides]|uniref:GAF and ANTAR domain-containing protein n=1 Tax=Nocardioides sp. URHA0032 TaxID=1380388 RepID=UPI0009DD0207|nr:GAF and ANTAR domain-containing protein [Nocardioides sp. URHA0032]